METGNGETLRVLFIEDNRDDVTLIVWDLRKAGYKLIYHIVESEAALIAALHGGDWDMILCDFKLPILSPYRALEIVKAHKPYEIPFIVVSGSVNEESAIDLMKAGARDFISKDNRTRLPMAIQRETRATGERMRARLIMEDTYNQTLEALGKALELRDSHTAGHTNRVTDLTLRLARAIQLPHIQFINIYRGCLIHDVGKMGIPDEILLKKGALTDQERAVMQKHPTLAYEWFQHIPFLREALNIPYCHHERYDGTGYPQGLKGNNIPFEARLFSIVDVYDALTSRRPYRFPWEKEKALEYLQEQKGLSFDPGLVDKFLEILE